MSLLRDSAAGALVLSLLLLPSYFFLPSLVAPLVSTARALLSSFLWVCGLAIVGVSVLGTALFAEKAYRRWYLKEERPTPAPRSDDGVGRGGNLKTAHGTTRLATGSQIDAAAEKVIERLEQSSVGRLVRRKVRGATGKRGGGGGPGDVELKELKRGVAGTTAVRRAPPPPPPR